MTWRNLCLAAAFAVTGVLAAENLIDAPQKLELERATYRKITIKWEYPAGGTQIAGYRIYGWKRNFPFNRNRFHRYGSGTG